MLNILKPNTKTNLCFPMIDFIILTVYIGKKMITITVI